MQPKTYKPKMDAPESWAERYRLAGEDWANKDASANLLEDTKPVLFAQKCKALGDIPVNRAEMEVKSTPEWEEHIHSIVEARRVANVAKVELEAIRIEYQEWSNKEANARTEARML